MATVSSAEPRVYPWSILDGVVNPLRHRQREHRYDKRGDRRCVWWRERNRRWTGVRFGLLEGVYAAPDEHGELEHRLTVGAAGAVRGRRSTLIDADGRTFGAMWCGRGGCRRVMRRNGKAGGFFPRPLA